MQTIGMNESLGSQIWHSVGDSEVSEALSTDQRTGLDQNEVDNRKKRYGLNRISEYKQQSPLIKFLLQFHQPLIYILLVAALLTAFLGEWIDTAVILLVVIINAIVGYIQEAKALRAIQALADSMKSYARVIRSGEEIEVSSEDLVPGDIVLLEAGDRVPADLRLFQLRDLQIDESALTGESVPVEKSLEVLPKAVEIADRKNMAFGASMVTFGRGRGVVVATGDRTEMGKISQLVSSAEVLQTPLTKKIAEFSHWLMWVILALAAFLFLLGMFQGQPLVLMLMTAIAMIVSAIPEGMPAAITIMLAIGVSRMAKRKAIVRKLPAIETLGSTSVICTDKTGTLTQNQMTVQKVFTGDEIYSVTGVGYEPSGEIIGNQNDKQASEKLLKECALAGVLCNNSLLLLKEGSWSVQGDPTEGAFIVLAEKLGIKQEKAKSSFPRLDEIPFQSEYQYMATLHQTANGSLKTTAYIKGSVEAVLSRCDLKPEEIETIEQIVKDFGQEGLRVLAFAKAEFGPEKSSVSHGDIKEGLKFLGLQAMLDPPRPEAKAAIEQCKGAGISVKMITGDHAVTAAKIASDLGLAVNLKDMKNSVMTGRELKEISDSDLIDVAHNISVFARVSPEQKLKLVRALQSQGHVVAMTGDGVNDAPALRQSDIGVAMGLKGTEVAREASDMILADDNFASIEAAVEEGRNVFDNLVKFIVWTLPTNLGESLILIIAVGLGLTLPILPVQVLWVNMTTSVLLGLTLAFEPMEPGVMDRMPRPKDESLLHYDLIMRTLFVGVYIMLASFAIYIWEESRGHSITYARSAVVTTIVLVEAGYLLNCRSLLKPINEIGVFTNMWVWYGIGLMLIFQIAFIHLPFMNRLFSSEPLRLDSWGVITASALLLIVLVNIEKRIRSQWA